MINIELIKYSLRNLSHRKGRSFLTIFSIFVGIMTVFLFASFGLGLNQYVNDFASGSSIDKVIVMAKGSGAIPSDTFGITKDEVGVIERAAGVYEATGLYLEVVQVERHDEKSYAYITSYDPRTPIILDIFGVDIEDGRALRPGDDGVVLGYNYKMPDKIFDKGLEVNDAVTIKGEKFKVLGFFESVGNPQDDANVYMTNERFEEVFVNKTKYVEAIARINIDERNKAIENIERGLRKERNLEEGKEDFYVQSFEDMVESYSSILIIVPLFILMIALISVLVSAINTANTMITSVLERYKEIGILKAIGARNSEVFSIFLFESAFLGFVAGALGVFLGWIISSVAGNVLILLGYGFLQPAMPWWLFVSLILFATLTGGISGLIPSVKASKTNTVDALRYE